MQFCTKMSMNTTHSLSSHIGANQFVDARKRSDKKPKNKMQFSFGAKMADLHNLHKN